MEKIQMLTLGDYRTNCYLVRAEDAKLWAVIDPGYAPEQILAQAGSRGIAGILLTHGHFDHVGGVAALVQKTGCDVYLCARDLLLPPELTVGPLQNTRPYGASVTLAGLTFQVLNTPGHTPGSVCLYTGQSLFSGDTLFAGTCGRTDLPGGSWEQMQRSLELLAALPGDCRVYPGHGGTTTLEQERRFNPYMVGAL